MLLDESRFAWSKGDRTSSTTSGRTRIEFAIDRGAVVVRTCLLSLDKELSADAAAALTHFLIALNGSLRFARATLSEAALALEAVFPIAALRPSIVDRAVDAVAIGAAAAKSSCAALTNDDVAKQYLNFHERKVESWKR